jgi:hypothetical protein
MQQRNHGLVNDEHGKPADDKRRSRSGKRVRPDDRTRSPS